MHNSPSRLGGEYSHETVKVKVPEVGDDRVTVTLNTPNGEVTVWAKHVAGCDGFHSTLSAGCCKATVKTRRGV